MQSNIQSRAAVRRGQRLTHPKSGKIYLTPKFSPHQELSAVDCAQAQGASLKKPVGAHGIAEAQNIRNTYVHGTAHHLTRQECAEAATRGGLCQPEYQVVLRSQLEVVVLSHQRASLELQIEKLAADQNYQFSTDSSTWNAIRTAAESIKEVRIDMLIRQLLLRDLQVNPRQTNASLSDPVLLHKAHTLLAQRGQALKGGLPDPTQIQYPSLEMNMDLDQAKFCLEILDLAKSSAAIKELKEQAAYMQSRSEFNFNPTTSEHHALIHNLNRLKAAQEGMEALYQKLRRRFNNPKLTKSDLESIVAKSLAIYSHGSNDRGASRSANRRMAVAL